MKGEYIPNTRLSTFDLSQHGIGIVEEIGGFADGKFWMLEGEVATGEGDDGGYAGGEEALG